MGQISFQYSAWYLLVFFMISIGIAIMVYSKNKAFSDRTTGQKLLLAALRTFGIFLLFILLLNPILKKLTEYSSKPILVIAQDGSRSIPYHSKAELSQYLAERDKLIQELEDEFLIQTLDMSDKVYTIARDSFDGNSTDINSLLEYCTDHLDLRNVKAMVLASDGIYNQGKNPLYNSILKQLPVYTIMLGDTTLSKDFAISNIFYNELIHAGDEFITQVDLKAFNCANATVQLQLKEFKNNSWQLLNSQNIQIQDNSYFKTLDFKLATIAPGVYRYKVETNTLPDETNKINNVREFYVQVLESKTKVLILANSPHPDIAALKSALLTNKNYIVETNYSIDQRLKLDDVKAIILHQLPSLQHSSNKLMALLQNKNIPILYVLGEATHLNEFNKMQDHISIQAQTKSMNEVVPILNRDFYSFSLSINLQSNLEKFAPINAAFGNYEFSAAVNVLCYQKIGKVDTKYPLWAISDKSGFRQAFIFGDGIWKWRLNEFHTTQTSLMVDELISKTIQFVSTKADDRRLRVKPAKTLFGSGENISFKAEFYNDNLARINDADLQLSLSDFNGNLYPFVFSKELDFYTLNCGSFEPGEYKYTAKLSWNQKEFKQEGRIAISNYDLETSTTTADHSLLKNIASKSGAKSYYPTEISALQNELQTSNLHKPTLYYNLESKPIIDSKWIFLLAFILLATEWFLRRYWGSY
ncbi:MAG: hypothetical protein IPM92_07030 [Saprospiraceae bacterium]|nr:hypothetical protein [Saprospiraceae bacterium]